MTKKLPPIDFNIMEYILCLVVALPSAALNGLAAISSDVNKAGQLHTLRELKNLLDESSVSAIFYGVIAFLASEAVLFFLNKLYLLASIRATFDLLKRTSLTLKSWVWQSPLNPRESAHLAENCLFVLSILTSLIFAEIGGQALLFLGLWGQVTGFALSLLVYFATRFASAKFFFDHLQDVNFQLKKEYCEKLALLDDSNTLCVDISQEEDTNQALIEFLTKIDEEWNVLAKKQEKIICFNYIAPTLSYSLMIITVFPIMLGFLPSSIQGLELLTQTDIGKHDHYQNPVSFILGISITALTVFFYELGIKDLPKNFLYTLLAIYEKIIDDKLSIAVQLIGLTILAATSSYLTSIGFKFIADTALTSGYLAYLGTRLSQVIPSGLLLGVTTMLWSHLQQLINQKVVATDDHVESPEQNCINIRNAESFIKLPGTDLSILQKNSKAMLWFGTRKQDDNDAVYQPLLSSESLLMREIKS